MRIVFADSAYFVALGSPRDEWHQQASDFAAGYRERILTTEFVLLEVGNYFSKSSFRAGFCELVRFLRGAQNVEVVPISHELWQRGFELNSTRLDKS